MVQPTMGRGSLSATTGPDAAGATAIEPNDGVLFRHQAQRDTQFRRLHDLFPSDRVAGGACVRALPQGQPLTVPGARASAAWFADPLSAERLMPGRDFQRH